LLYAALTGLWPGPDGTGLPPAPESDGCPRRPRQVRAGVPTVLDDVTCRALALPGRDQEGSYESPGQLATALAAAIPPLQVPPATTAIRDSRREADRFTQPQRAQRPAARVSHQAALPARRWGVGRVVAVSILVVIAVAGASAAAVHLLQKPHSAGHPGKSTSASTSPSARAAVVVPVSARGFDALNPADTGDENSSEAANVLDGNPSGWDTQQYYRSPYFGNLKAGTGMILDLGKAVRVSSVTVTFGSVPGADVQIKMGSSDARTKDNLDSMTTVATGTDVSGSYTFTVARPVTDQYLVIWFTKLPPIAQGGNRYMARIYGVVIRGTS
jgi:hypothetical protein